MDHSNDRYAPKSSGTTEPMKRAWQGFICSKKRKKRHLLASGALQYVERLAEREGISFKLGRNQKKKTKKRRTPKIQRKKFCQCDTQVRQSS